MAGLAIMCTFAHVFSPFTSSWMFEPCLCLRDSDSSGNLTVWVSKGTVEAFSEVSVAAFPSPIS